ncbi:MAG TPA: SPASM domain-containing protein [Chthoniobacter sp.]|nr:SPASM domain-containing protein [Chthoniobacter sp.]
MRASQEPSVEQSEGAATGSYLANRDYVAFATERGSSILLADSSGVFSSPLSLADLNSEIGLGKFDSLLTEGRRAAKHREEEFAKVGAFAIRTISLAVSQSCNLGCTYCYAEQGSFGAKPSLMSDATICASIDRLFEDTLPGESVSITFMGGEPFQNRRGIRLGVDHALTRSREKGVKVSFATTTNATLLDEDDARFLEEHGFAVTVSIDGTEQQHNAQRPHKRGSGSFAEVSRGAKLLLSAASQMQVSARVTVTPLNLDLEAGVEALRDLGFTDVGFSPLLSAPTGKGEMDEGSLDTLLEHMKRCGRRYLASLSGGSPFPFSNMRSALQEIRRGARRFFPCGAGVAYLGVGATGEYSPCHRFVGDKSVPFGDVTTGVDRTRQREWIAARNVQYQEPCNSCWARFLCGGGCHYEVLRRGRVSCDYIRGWLMFCLYEYERLGATRPELIDQL